MAPPSRKIGSCCRSAAVGKNCIEFNDEIDVVTLRPFLRRPRFACFDGRWRQSDAVHLSCCPKVSVETSRNFIAGGQQSDPIAAEFGIGQSGQQGQNIARS